IVHVQGYFSRRKGCPAKKQYASGSLLNACHNSTQKATNWAIVRQEMAKLEAKGFQDQEAPSPEQSSSGSEKDIAEPAEEPAKNETVPKENGKVKIQLKQHHQLPWYG